MKFDVKVERSESLEETFRVEAKDRQDAESKALVEAGNFD